MVEYSKSYSNCKSCSFQNLQEVSKCIQSVSNKTFLLHKSQLTVFFLSRKHFDQTRLTLYWNVLVQVYIYIYIISWNVHKWHQNRWFKLIEHTNGRRKWFLIEEAESLTLKISKLINRKINLKKIIRIWLT